MRRRRNFRWVRRLELGGADGLLALVLAVLAFSRGLMGLRFSFFFVFLYGLGSVVFVTIPTVLH